MVGQISGLREFMLALCVMRSGSPEDNNGGQSMDRIEQREGSSLSIREEEDKTISSQEMDKRTRESFTIHQRGEG